MAEFNITIDARGIFDPKFKIHPSSHDWLETHTPQSLLLPQGSYLILARSCTSTLKFSVTSAGKITFEPKFNTCLELQGQDPQVLKVKGLEVTIDATYVGMRGALGVRLGAGQEGRWIERETIRLLPGVYTIQQGQALISLFKFSLLETGQFDYDKSFDLSEGGFLEGRGGPVLAFRGYPFLIDAARLEGDFTVGFFNVTGLPVDEHVIFANLLPMNGAFRIGVGSPKDPSKKETTPLGVQILLNPPGQTKLFDGDFYALAQDTFHGLARLTVRKK